jgi:hypothetical protein
MPSISAASGTEETKGSAAAVSAAAGRSLSQKAWLLSPNRSPVTSKPFGPRDRAADFTGRGGEICKRWHALRAEPLLYLRRVETDQPPHPEERDSPFVNQAPDVTVSHAEPLGDLVHSQ